MRDLHYTVRDSPEVVARVGADLATVVDAVRANDSHLRSLVLTGGFARGEGAVLHGVPQNDYDFVAVRDLGFPRRPYSEVRDALETRLGIHIDLAPVASWRLRWVAPSIFWYETATRGRVLWGDDLLGRIPVKDARDLDRCEGLRLLVNRAAGLLLVSSSEDAHARRLQAAKAILAAFDARLLALGRFPPTQTERWRWFDAQREPGTLPSAMEALRPTIDWAYGFKVDPGTAAPRDAFEVWKVAAGAVLEAVPVALRHAGLDGLPEYGRRDGLADRLHYFGHTRRIPGTRRWSRYPTGEVRMATLGLLAEARDGILPPEAATRWLGPIATVGDDPLRLLDALRGATLQ